MFWASVFARWKHIVTFLFHRISRLRAEQSNSFEYRIWKENNEIKPEQNFPPMPKKKSPNKLSNNEQCPLPALYVLFRLKTCQQATGEQTDTENVSSIRGKDKSNTGERKQPDWLQTSCPKWKNKRCFVWSRQSNSQRAKQLSLSLEGLRCGYSKHRVTDEFNIMVKGQLNQ